MHTSPPEFPRPASAAGPTRRTTRTDPRWVRRARQLGRGNPIGRSLMRLSVRSVRPAVRSLLPLLVFLGVTLGVARAAPPPNDDFATATVVAALPFSSTVVMNEATTESGEPFFCSFSTQPVWYRFTASTDMWISGTGSGFFSGLSVYRDPGGGFFSLTSVACTSFTGQALFLAHAGNTYALQAVAQCCGGFRALSLTLQPVAAPVPQVHFFFFPNDPSAFDLVQFNDQTFDPGGQPITSRHYDYGDGGSSGGDSTTCCPQHRFTADGDYVVTLTATTLDGRTGT